MPSHSHPVNAYAYLSSASHHPPPTQLAQEDFVVLKMDVEGAEIDILPKLLSTNASSLIDVFLWECHAKWRGSKGKCQCAARGANLGIKWRTGSGGRKSIRAP